MQSRRKFLKNTSYLAALPLFGSVLDALGTDFPKGKGAKVLLRSSWQTVNIGDIGHTFGIMELFQKYIPEAEITLWPVSIDNGVDDLMRKKFPELGIVEGNINQRLGFPKTQGESISDKSHSKPDTPQLQKAFDECHIMIHGSGPYVAARNDLEAWWKQTGKPFGIYGVTLDAADEDLQKLISNASFLYCRDTDSLKFIKSLRLKCPVQEFAPDATFAINLHDDIKAKAYLKAAGLKSGEFICAIPRLRYTPYFQIRNTQPTAEESRKYEESLKYKEIDAAKLRQVITRWVRETGLKVLACPEMTYQVSLSKEVLVDPLPEDVKKNVVWRDSYWNPDEAGSVYKHARALVSFEMHSPIIAFSEGIPSIHLRQPTDTRKGQMWDDIGLGEWLFEIDSTNAQQIGDALMKIHRQYGWAEEEMKKATQVVKNRQEVSMKTIQKIQA